MKTTQITIFAILAISATIKSAAQPNCAGTTATWCVYCLGSSCQSCAKGFPATADTKCTAPTTAIANCISYSDATTCSACQAGRVLISNVCELPDTPLTGCYMYTGTTKANAVCTACNTDLYPAASTGTPADSYSTAGVKTISACQATKPTAANTPGLIDGCANHYASNASTGAVFIWECAMCKATHFWASATSCVNGTTSPNTLGGCAMGTAPSTCTMCHTTHQMTEPNVCTLAPGATYSAILSVVSMIVALMFANF